MAAVAALGAPTVDERQYPEVEVSLTGLVAITRLRPPDPPWRGLGASENCRPRRTQDFKISGDDRPTHHQSAWLT